MKRKRAEDLQAVIERVAPPAPPCFDARDIWISYLMSAIEVQDESNRNRGPLVRVDGRLTSDLDPTFSFCADCEFSQVQLANMRRNHTCQPDWWHRQTARRVIPIEPIAA